MNELEIIVHPQIEGLSVFINTVNYRTPHVHPDWEMILVLENPLSVTCSQMSFTVKPGQMVLFSPNELHEFHKIEDASTFLCIQVSSDILPMGYRMVMDGKRPDEYLSEEELRQLKSSMMSVALAYLKREENYELYCLGECYLIMYELISRIPYHILTAEESSVMDKRNARLDRLIRYVDENYMHKIRLSDFAKMEGCSMTHLSHFIKRAMNQTFQEYVSSVRFNRACELMAAGERKMLDVCMESGFSDYRYFSRAFRQRYNMTPEEYANTAVASIPERAVVHRSLHSMERFYSREDSLTILRKYL